MVSVILGRPYHTKFCSSVHFLKFGFHGLFDDIKKGPKRSD